MALGQDAGMHIQVVAFDVNGTLVKILAEDGSEDIFRAAAHFLTYQGSRHHSAQKQRLGSRPHNERRVAWFCCE